MVSVEVLSEVFNVGSVRATGVLEESVKLVSGIVDVSLRALLEEVDISDDRAIVENFVKGRR